MKQFEKIKGFMQGLKTGKKKWIVLGCLALIVGSVALAASLNKKDAGDLYSTLFSGLNQQEASEVMTKLQELGVDYRYQQDGRVMVDTAVVDQTRATLAVEGYPKDGFSYDIYLDNTNMMSTESEKETLKVMAMQERLQSTIRQFEGVDRAIVQISPGENKKYVLDNSGVVKPTASVMVYMKDGTSPTPKQVEGIQRLISKSVSSMDMGDVAVIDGNGIDVSVRKSDSDTMVSDEKMAFEEKSQLMIESKILNVLEDMYGRNNVRVSVRCTVDMQKTLSEESNYTAPNVEQNSGYITHQTLTNENTGGAGAGGVPGAGANANVPQYNTQTGAAQNNSNSSSDTDYLYNQRKTQSQYDGGQISDISVAVNINTGALGVDKIELTSLIARAAGIDPAVQNDKITIINTQWPTTILQDPNQQGDDTIQTGNDDPNLQPKTNNYLIYIIIGCVVGLLIILLIIILLIRRSKKKAAKALEEAMLAAAPLSLTEGEDAVEMLKKIQPITLEEERGKELKDSIRSFAHENPEISAQLLKTWLRGEEDDA